jgi:glucokinase
LTKEDVKHLHGPSDIDNLPIGPKVCIGAGTGLGECYLTPTSDDIEDYYYNDDDENNDHNFDDDGAAMTMTTSYKKKRKEMQYLCFPSEGGHVEYAPRDDLEIEMFQYLSHKFESKHRISVERVVSGIGLANVYDFLAYKYPSQIDDTIHTTFLHAGDLQGAIVAANSTTSGSLCAQAMDIMMSAYGCEAGSCAIKWIPIGGLFLTGGITPKNIHHIVGHHTSFMQSYLHKGRVSTVLERIPCFAVLSDDLGVRGVHRAAQREYENYLVSTIMTSSTTNHTLEI